jgi:hypothetical protein
MMVLGVGMFGAAAAGLFAGAVQGAFGEGAMLYLGLLATMGVGMFAVGAFRLPSWARERQRQMSEVAARLAGRAQPSLERPKAQPPDIP